MKNIIGRIAGYRLHKSMDELKSLKKLSKEDYWAKQQQKRDGIFKYHYTQKSWYTNFVGKTQSIGWEEIPVITKSDLQLFSSQMHSNTFQYNRYIASTSGSSGHPFFFHKNKYCHSIAWAGIQNSYSKLGILSTHKEARYFGHVKGNLITKTSV